MEVLVQHHLFSWDLQVMSLIKLSVDSRRYQCSLSSFTLHFQSEVAHLQNKSLKEENFPCHCRSRLEMAVASAISDTLPSPSCKSYCLLWGKKSCISIRSTDFHFYIIMLTVDTIVIMCGQYHDFFFPLQTPDGNSLCCFVLFFN